MTHNADGSDPSASVPPRLQVPRPDEQAPAGEMATLRGWLDYLRGSALHKLNGLDDEQIRWRPTPTSNSLGGIVMHLGYSERLWLRVVIEGEAMDLGWTENRYAPTFVVPHCWSAQDVADFYRAESVRADQVLDHAQSLDQRSKAEMRPTTLRWALTHLVEDGARHCGHMDITRELIDGSTGR